MEDIHSRGETDYRTIKNIFLECEGWSGLKPWTKYLSTFIKLYKTPAWSQITQDQLVQNHNSKLSLEYFSQNVKNLETWGVTSKNTYSFLLDKENCWCLSSNG